MDWRHSLARLLARRPAPHDLVTVASEVLPEVMERLPGTERVTFLREMVTACVGPLLRNLGREERAQR